MATDKKRSTTRKKPSVTPAKKTAPAKARRGNKKDRVAALLAKFEAEVDGNQMKISVADYLKLLQFKRDNEDNEPKRIEATWIDSLEQTPSIDE